jgi:pyrimidine operon attenuation protein/uracil phosphoribosyltransferase
MERPTVLMHAEEMARTLDRLAYQILEKHGGGPDLALIGIQRRGADLAARIAAIVKNRLERDVPCGALDIALYRDDWTSVGVRPTVGPTSISFSIHGRDLILIDDVLFTTRTVRAAMEALLDFGRPRRVELLVLIDRGHHELPIHADYVGRSVNTARDEHVDVLLTERDGHDEVRLTSR